MTSVTVTAQRVALATMFDAAVSALTVVYTRVPREVQPGELPALILMPGPAQYSRGIDTWGHNQLMITREWMAMVLARQIGQGAEYEAELDAEQFLVLIPEALAKYKRLTDATGKVFEINIEGASDEGIEEIRRNSQVYTGVTVTFTTVTVEPITPVSS